MRVVVVSTHRSDKAHYAPLLRCLRATPGLSVALYAYNRAYEEWAPKDVAGIDVMAKTRGHMSMASAGNYDAGIVLGDRYEMLLAAAQLVEARVPLLHIHGGEHTYGSLDERWRWAMSAMADVHCVATKKAYESLRWRGSNRGKFYVTGAPGLDDIHDRQPFPNAPKIVVLYNPAIDEETTRAESLAIAQAVFIFPDEDWLWLKSNGDRFSDVIPCSSTEYDSEKFRDLLAAAHVIVGNSSAGIIEAPSLGTWTVNVGERQAGRPRAGTVMDVKADPAEISDGIRIALGTPRTVFPNPYGDGHASERIRDVLIGMAR